MDLNEHELARGADVKVRPLAEADLPTADLIFRQAFGTFLGLPDPSATFGDADYARTRWLADPTASLGAELNGELVASNFVTRWAASACSGRSPCVRICGTGASPSGSWTRRWTSSTSGAYAWVGCSRSRTARSTLASTTGTVSGLNT